VSSGFHVPRKVTANYFVLEAGVLFLTFACFCDPKCFPDTFNKRFGVFPRPKMSAL
jgi:hypothetical protein